MHRELAIRQAHEVLSSEGFARLEGEEWGGFFKLNGVTISAKCLLTEDFPYAVPHIRINRRTLPRQIPHVEKDGKLCLFSETGLLIDPMRPGDIVGQSLSEAKRLLQAGLEGSNANDFLDEFLGYWRAECDGGLIRSICKASAPSREIQLVHFAVPPPFEADAALAADDIAAGKEWLSRIGARFKHSESAWLHCLQNPVFPPEFEEKFRTGGLMRIARANSSSEDCRAFEDWLMKAGLPRKIIICMPSGKGDSILFAVQLNRAMGKHREDALRGFRESSLTVSREFKFTLAQRAPRINVFRCDREYLLPRAGGTTTFQDKKVVVIGCGAIGSHLAMKLSELGVGTLRLVDDDVLSSDNIHRHALGAEYLCQSKAKALGVAIGKRFPHIAVEHKEQRVQTVVQQSRDFLFSADLICIAIGDETTELWLNEECAGKLPRLHAWVEPLGIGGHVLVTGCPAGNGCFRCLFRYDDELGFNNNSAFARARQSFGRTIAGCGGTFTPFSSWDADRTAAEATQLAANILLAKQHRNVLASWYGDPSVFIGKGFKLSQRASLFRAGETKVVDDFQDAACACREWRALH